MTNTAGHSDRRAHCSLCPDGPRNKSAQAEADFQYREVGASACLLFSSGIAQALALNSCHSHLYCGYWKGGGGRECVCVCMHMYVCV